MFRLIPKTVVFLLPFLVSTPLLHAQDPPVNASLLGQWDGWSGSYADVWAEGPYAYIGTYGGNVIYIIDITDPTAPTMAGQVFAATGSAQDVKVHNGLLFIPGGDVLIIDVRDPGDPATLINIDLQGFGEAHNLFYDNGYLYYPSSNNVGIVDLTTFDPDNPPADPITDAKWILEGVGSSNVHDITVQDGRLYACAWDSGLWIYDVSDVADTEPSFLGSAPGDNTHSCWPSPDGRFVVTGEERSGGGIKVFEITDNGGSLTLTLTDSLAMPGEAYSVHNQFVIGYRVYNSWYGAGLQVLDIDPVTGTLSFVASYDTSGAWGVYPANGDALILISDMQAGLYLIEIDKGSINDDCNINGIDDSIDIARGTSTDCNGNGIPDECEPILDQDCNGNGILDACDIDCGPAGGPPGLPGCGQSTDCNANGVPDECDIADGLSLDCNQTAVPDECEVITPGDFDAEGQVDLDDFAAFATYMGGPGEAPPASPDCLDAVLAAFDFDGDGDADLADFAAFQAAFTGP